VSYLNEEVLHKLCMIDIVVFWVMTPRRRYTPYTPGLSNAAPVIYFPGALFYSAGFNVNQNFKEKIFLNNSMFQFFS
jgi:hypothetical protein